MGFSMLMFDSYWFHPDKVRITVNQHPIFGLSHPCRISSSRVRFPRENQWEWGQYMACTPCIALCPIGPNSSIQIVYPNHCAQCLENPRPKWCFLMGKPSINFNKWWIFHQAMFDEQRVHYSWIFGNVWAPWGFSSFLSGMFRQQNVAQFL